MQKSTFTLILLSLALACVLLGYGIFGVTVNNQNTTNTNLSIENQQLIERLDILTSNSSDKDAQILYLQSELEANEIALGGLKQQILNLTAENNLLRENEDLYKDEIKSNELTIELLTTKVDFYEDENDNLNAQIQTLQSQLDTANARIDELVAELNANNELFQKLVSGEITVIKATDLNGVKELRPYAFYGCTNLTSVELPSTLEVVGANAFNGCSSLQTITFNEGLKRIDSNAFRACQVLNETLTFPDSLQEISNNAFMHCTTLKAVNFTANSNLYKLGDSAFNWCFALENISLGNNLKYIGSGVFGSTPFESNNTTGILTSIDASKNYLLKVQDTSITTLDLSNINVVASSACRGLTNLTEVTIPSTCEYIGSSAFDSLGITSLTIEEGVKEIYDYAFSYCSNITEVNLPNSIIYLGDGAFRYCEALKNITLGENITQIYQNTFGQVSPNVIVIQSPTVLNTDGYMFYDICTAGLIVVPDELVEEYKTNSFYSNVVDRICAISEYEVA